MRTLTSSLAVAAALALSAGAVQAERGSDGQLNILYWQAPSTLNPYLSGGTKESDSSSLILEPLARYDSSGEMVPYLAEEIPTVANGGVSEDLTSITWKIKDGMVWSDGTPVTADDVVFTHAYCTDPEGGCARLQNFANVASVEALDAQTVKVTFDGPKPFPYGPFVGAESPIIQKAQFADCLGTAAPQCTDQNFGPIGTGPFRVVDFKPNDVIAYEANPNYRDPAKPAFATVNFKGGGDAQAAARAVLETKEFDYAWNLQIDPVVLADMESRGNGKVIAAFGAAVERMMVNHTNPSADLGDKRSTVEAGPHPFLTDPAVTKALSMAIDRQILVDVGYGFAGKPTCNVVPAPAAYVSTANDWCLTQDIDGANKLLDEAGWVMGGDGVRAKDGVRLSILYQTSTNAVRQDTQALVKDWWRQIGVETELRNIDASVFFGGDPNSPDTFQKFYADIEMYTNLFNGTDPESYMKGWTCPEQIPAPGNGWQGNNIPRYCNDDYNALAEKLAVTAPLEERAAIVREMNDILMGNFAMIPLIHRGRVSAHGNSLGGIDLNVWDSELWNIADWYRQ